jgi:hypothetical protein
MLFGPRGLATRSNPLRPHWPRAKLTSVLNQSETGEVSYWVRVARSVSSVTDALGASTNIARPVSGTLDLQAEAARIRKNRQRTVVLGLVIGATFAAIGVAELTLFSGPMLTGNTVVAVLLIVLGASIAWLSNRGGLRNPVTKIALAEDGVTFSRWTGRPVRFAWSDPTWDLEIQDPSPDPSIRPEEKEHLFFLGRGQIYGTMTRSSVGPILDAAREHGLAVSMKDVTTGRRGEHIVRRIRLRSYRAKSSAGAGRA